MVIALIASLVAGLATGVGGLLVVWRGPLPMRTLDIIMGFSGGVMLSATAFSLVLPALNATGWPVVGASILLGGLIVYGLDLTLPHLYQLRGRQLERTRRGAILVAVGISLHNLPEGLAVGVAFATADASLGLSLAIAIGLHNIPEGVAVAAPLAQSGVPRRVALGIALLSGLAEPVGAMAGLALLRVVDQLLPWALGFAGGAMLYVTSKEVIPESHSHGYETLATFGLMVGFVVMIALQQLLS